MHGRSHTDGRPHLQHGVVGGKVRHAEDLRGDGRGYALSAAKCKAAQSAGQPEQRQARKRIQHGCGGGQAGQYEQPCRPGDVAFPHGLIRQDAAGIREYL